MRSKLFLFTDCFPFGDGERAFLEAELRLLAKSYEVTVVSLAIEENPNWEDAQKRLPPNVGLVHCGQRLLGVRIVSLLRFPFTRIGWREIKEIIKDRERVVSRIVDAAFSYSNGKRLQWQFRRAGVFDEVAQSLYYTFWFNWALLACIMEKEKKPAMVVVSRVHGYELYNERGPHGRQPLQRYKARGVDAVIFAAKRPRQYFLDAFCAGEDRERFDRISFVVFLGTAAPKTIPAKPQGSPFKIVSCSNVIPLKRVERIAQALMRVEGDFRWIHFGDGSAMSDLEAAALGLGGRVSLKGFVSHGQVIEYYEREHVDLFITLTETEGGCPVSIQEALSYGVPVIATDVGGVNDAIDGNGILLPADPSIEEVAQAIKGFMGYSDGKKEKMSNRSIQLWKKQFCAEKNAEETRNILSLLC